MLQLPKQQQFAQDLHNFITNHPYFKSEGGTFLEEPQDDRTIYNIADPDGDYEELTIILEYKP